MMAYLEKIGFTPLQAKGPVYGAREGMASHAQLELIRCLWAELTRHACPGEDELNTWLLKCFKISSLRFLTKTTAPKIITALKAMKSRPKAKPEPQAKAS